MRFMVNMTIFAAGLFTGLIACSGILLAGPNCICPGEVPDYQRQLRQLEQQRSQSQRDADYWFWNGPSRRK